MAGERSVAGEAIFAPPVVGDAAVVGHRSLGRPLPQAVGAAPEGRRSPGIGGRSCGPPVPMDGTTGGFSRTGSGETGERMERRERVKATREKEGFRVEIGD